MSTIIQPFFSKEALIDAIQSINIALVEEMIQAGVPINLKDEMGRSPLSHAISSGDPRLVKLLLDNGAHVSNTQEIISPLLLSYLSGRIEMVKTLAPHMLLNADNAAASLPLGVAVRNQDRETAKTFLKIVDNAEEKLNYTALHQAVENNDLAMAQIILNQSTPEQINHLDAFGYAPLHLAILNRYTEMVTLLITHGANPLLTTTSRQNAFDLANQKSFPEMIIILSEATSSDHLITQEEFTDLLITPRSEHIHLASLLEEQGFSPVLKGLKLTDYDFPIQYDVTGVDFINCQFEGRFENLTFQGVIENSSFRAFECTNCVFKPGTVITHSTFQDGLFQNVHFEQTTFSHNHFFYFGIKDSYFNHATLHDNYIYGSQLWNIQLEDPLLKGLKIKESDIHETTLNGQNELLPSTFEHTPRTKPIIATLGEISEINDFSRPGFLISEPYLRIKQAGALPLLISLDHFYKSFDLNKLNQEVKQVLSELPPETERQESIAQFILHSNQPTINALNAFAKTYADGLDGLWIPGGPDIHPDFYRTDNGRKFAFWGYEDDLFELALIDHMVQAGKPILGVCHGSQLLNVYFGGTLLQDVPGHRVVIQPIHVLNNNGLLGEDLSGNKVWGFSNHHQAIDKLADPLEKVAEYDGIIKAAQGKELPVFLSQFHPEYLLDDNNASLLDSFFNMTKARMTLMQQDIFTDPVLGNDILTEALPLLPPPPSPLPEDILHFFAQNMF